MKILLHHNIESLLPAVDAIPDSAILRDGKPFFIPEWSETWTYTPYLAFKISRLGKNIASRFAMRYVDAVTIALRVTPVEATETVAKTDIQRGVVTAFDSSIILGEWTPIPMSESRITMEIGGHTIELDDAVDRLATSIENLSKYFTLKMGDIIIPPTLSNTTIPMIIDTTVVGKVNNTEVLKFNIK